MREREYQAYWNAMPSIDRSLPSIGIISPEWVSVMNNFAAHRSYIKPHSWCVLSSILSALLKNYRKKSRVHCNSEQLLCNLCRPINWQDTTHRKYCTFLWKSKLSEDFSVEGCGNLKVMLYKSWQIWMCGSLVCHHVNYVFYYCFVCCTYPCYFPFFFFLNWIVMETD